MAFAESSVSCPELSLVDWLRIIRGEYLEFPGLHLTCAQAQRLWNLDTATCETLLETLVNTRFLRRSRNGGYVLAD